ncbi:MAG TPA: hypoxanthine phosphoribosyltransferase [Candidatus Rifleibacterium sp.]|jgi:hypoxanthine phosphoribosyltransferase|nr:hypoxanthine phosphoribosyltransferase [Candidatus Rifleibacterium sp.]HPW58705.1 hypoxanthine phosphoribosyltransferase [Candidatus Rifleibacterium sp.]
MSKPQKTDKHIKHILIDPESIQKRITELGAEISADYRGKELVLVCILKGAFLFTSDLCRQIDLPQKLDFMAVSSYGDATRSSGIVKIEKDLSESIQGKHVLIVEDIIDSGLTLSYIVKILQDRQPADIKVCVLCNKPSNQQQHVKVDYCGFKLEDEFVVGYGLDFKGYLRNLPYIGVVKDEYR